MSDTSLKGLIQAIAKGVDTTPAALYERQRALVRAGLLQSKPGRGPGSGVRATPQSVSMLLISILATGNLSETEERSKGIAGLKSQTQSCPLTGKKTFASALAAALASEDLARRLRWIEVRRSGSAAEALLAFNRPPEEIITDQDFEEMRRSPEGRAAVLKKRGRNIGDSTTNIISSRFGQPHPRWESMLKVTASLAAPFDAIGKALKSVQEEIKKHERQHHPTRKT